MSEQAMELTLAGIVSKYPATASLFEKYDLDYCCRGKQTLKEACNYDPIKWLYFSLFYDAILLLFMFQFGDYPLEKPMLFLCALNPVDLARVLILLQLDVSALMGYTGALYQQFFGSSAGMIFSFSLMLLWLAIPLWFSRRAFLRKDL